MLSFSATGQATLNGELAGSQRTQRPIVTGASVIALKYKDGIMMSADTLGSYGSMARYRSTNRIRKVGDQAIIGGSGDYSDFQSIMQTVDKVIEADWVVDDGSHLEPRAVQQYLSRVMYNRRSKMDPLWNELVLGGVSNGKSFLGYVDLRGGAYEASVLATGFGAYVAIPLLRKFQRDDMTYDEAKKLLEDCQRVCWYRHCQASDKIQVATITAEGSMISEPYVIESKWDYSAFQNTEYSPFW